jgi:pSer/pThr/pTyr-binding forkhead associated (FHA) protein
LRGSDIVVKDLNSTNGTYINDEQITEAVLKPGQTLRLGMVELQLENGNAPASATAPPSTKKTTVPVRPPAGVKIDELERPKPLGISPNSPFKKKTNKVNLIFAGIGIVLAILVIIFLVIAITKTGHSIHP